MRRGPRVLRARASRGARRSPAGTRPCRAGCEREGRGALRRRRARRTLSLRGRGRDWWRPDVRCGPPPTRRPRPRAAQPTARGSPPDTARRVRRTCRPPPPDAHEPRWDRYPSTRRRSQWCDLRTSSVPTDRAPRRSIGRRDRASRGAAPCAGRMTALARPPSPRSEEHTSELQSLMRISYAVFCLKQKKKTISYTHKVFQLKDNKHRRVKQNKTKRNDDHPAEHIAIIKSTSQKLKAYNNNMNTHNTHMT